MTLPQELNFDQLQERADIGELNFAELGKMCWDELNIYVQLIDDFHSLFSTGKSRSERHKVTPHPFIAGALIVEDGSWREHHNAIEKLRSLAWHTSQGGVRNFLRLLEAFKHYHLGWRSEVLEPTEQRLSEALKSGGNPLLPQIKSLLEQAKDSYLRFLDLKDIGEGLVDDFFDESRYALRPQAELERANANLKKALQLERQLRHDEVTELRAENPFDLPLGVQDFALREIEASAHRTGFKGTRRQLQKHLANWKGADRERGERWLLSRAELEEFLRYLSQRQRAKP